MRISPLFPLFLVFFCLNALAQPNSSPSLQNQIDAIVKPTIEMQQIPGIAIAIYYKGRDYTYSYGLANQEKNIPVTPDTIFHLASVTKVFTATLLAIEVKAHKMQLNDPITKYLPSLASTKGLSIDQVKVVDLATHTASFPRDIMGFGAAPDDVKSLLVQLRTWQPAYPIGTKYVYSNISFGLLGDLIEHASGQSYMSLLKQTVLDPLNMQNTMLTIPKEKQSQQAQGYSVQGQPITFPTPPNLIGAGMLASSAADMLKFLKANLGIANANPALLDAMQLAQQAYFRVNSKFSLGLGWERRMQNGSLFLTKNGGLPGFNTFVGFAPTQKIAVVVLTNKRDGKGTVMGNQILRALANQ